MTLLPSSWAPEAAFAVSYLAWFGLVRASVRHLRDFMQFTQVVADVASLDRYKGVVRTEMYRTLVMYLVLMACVATSMLLVVERGWPGVAAAVVMNIAMAVAGVHLSRVEKSARTLPSVAEQYEEEHRRVTNRWKR